MKIFHLRAHTVKPRFWRSHRAFSSHWLYIVEETSECTETHNAGSSNVSNRLDCLSKEEAGLFLSLWVHTTTFTKDLFHKTQKFVEVAGDCLILEFPPRRSMATWTCHIDCYYQQYYNAFAPNAPFRADLLNQVHKQVQVLLHFFNTMSVDNSGYRIYGQTYHSHHIKLYQDIV